LAASSGFRFRKGEIRELKLENGNGEAERFYRQLSSPALMGLEASGNTQWFEDLLDRLGHEVWMEKGRVALCPDASEPLGNVAAVSANSRKPAAHQYRIALMCSSLRSIRNATDRSPYPSCSAFSANARRCSSSKSLQLRFGRLGHHNSSLLLDCPGANC